jgi:hypothetical protein
MCLPLTLMTLKRRVDKALAVIHIHLHRIQSMVYGAEHYTLRKL